MESSKVLALVFSFASAFASAFACADSCSGLADVRLAQAPSTSGITSTAMTYADGSKADPNSEYVAWRTTADGKTIVYRRSVGDLQALGRYLKSEEAKSAAATSKSKEMTDQDVSAFIGALVLTSCRKVDGSCSGSCSSGSCQECCLHSCYCCCR